MITTATTTAETTITATTTTGTMIAATSAIGQILQHQQYLIRQLFELSCRPTLKWVQGKWSEK